MKTTVHIINHTHWDREWFLTSIYTTNWIPRLIDTIEHRVAENPNFRFLLDGQTLVIEDLLQHDPDYQERVKKLVKDGHLIIGPYYCQPDWKLTGEEALVRNLLYGRQDMQQFGGRNQVGWLTDTFGHISQSPQLHDMFGLEAVFVWRGVPQLTPYFHWQGADGSRVLAINLFGGYRNLYGVTHAPEVAIKRLQTEISKLQPYYPTPDIPLFDGYDLEQNPEDPMRFYQQHASELPDDLQLEETTPHGFVQTVSPQLTNLPIINGELNSGKYGATFPGTLSTRTYLKVMHSDSERLLFKIAEPLAVLARLKGRPYRNDFYEHWGRILLQNAVHDCICGVSVDQVHEKMEYSYREMHRALSQDVEASLMYVLRDFKPGVYAVSTEAFAYEGWRIVDDTLYPMTTDGIGVWPLEQQIPVSRPHEPVVKFRWQNEHYVAAIDDAGVVHLNEAQLGYLVLSEENGDTYSEESGEKTSRCSRVGHLVIEEQSERHCIVGYECAGRLGDASITAHVHITFDLSPLIRWQVDLDSRGTDFKVTMVFETGLRGDIHAGMPFDVVKREPVDRDLLSRRTNEHLSKVLMGQRELGEVRTFPFHDFVAITETDALIAVMAKGVHAYQADDAGRIAIILRRAIEWITAPGLEHRSGDAGPFMYVPDARCERRVHHELAVYMGSASLDDSTFHRINAGFQNPPLVVIRDGDGAQEKWSVLQENFPLSSLYIHRDRIIARFYNPTNRVLPLSDTYSTSDITGVYQTTTASIPAKRILIVTIDDPPLPKLNPSSSRENIVLTNPPTWRVGENQGLPAVSIIKQLEKKGAQLAKRLVKMEMQLEEADGNDRHHLQHQYYVLERELYELKLSELLNRHKLTRQGQLAYDYLYQADPEIAEVGMDLNELRIKRRIYDYVIEAL
jgi:hypothetical protein